MSPSLLNDLMDGATNIQWDHDNEQLVYRWLRMKLHKNKVNNPEFPAGLLTKAASLRSDSLDIYCLVEKFLCKR